MRTLFNPEVEGSGDKKCVHCGGDFLFVGRFEDDNDMTYVVLECAACKKEETFQAVYGEEHE